MSSKNIENACYEKKSAQISKLFYTKTHTSISFFHNCFEDPRYFHGNSQDVNSRTFMEPSFSHCDMVIEPPPRKW